MTTIRNQVNELLMELGDEDGGHYLNSISMHNVSDDVIKDIVKEAKALKLITIDGSGDKTIIELTGDGKKVLADVLQGHKKNPPQTKNQTPKQEDDDMAKNKEKVKGTKPKAKQVKESTGETYGLPFRRTSVPSARWIAVDALMALDSPASAESVAKKIANKMPDGPDRAQAHVSATAAWLTKNGAKGFVGLAKKEKAEKPAKEKTKPKKAKAKKAKAASSDDAILE